MKPLVKLSKSQYKKVNAAFEDYLNAKLRQPRHPFILFTEMMNNRMYLLVSSHMAKTQSYMDHYSPHFEVLRQSLLTASQPIFLSSTPYTKIWCEKRKRHVPNPAYKKWLKQQTPKS